MNYTKEQIEKMADEYANQFMDGRDHFYGFKAGFEKALSLFAVSGRSEQLACIHNLERLRLIGGNITCLDCQSTWVRQAN